MSSSASPSPSLALLFPGQGSQSPGMGKAAAQAYPEAKAVFEEVDEALGEHFSRLIWEGTAEELTRTANAQPALMAVSLALWRALEARGFPLEAVRFAAGHSLGEYSALAAAGVFTAGEAARLLRQRGEAMQAAVAEGQGAMAALLGIDLEKAQEAAQGAIDKHSGKVCDIANDNAPGQVVVSGHREAVEEACVLAKGLGARRAQLLAVSAPFHCALMQPAQPIMQKALAEIPLRQPRLPIIANVIAQPLGGAEAIHDLLIQQITGRVRWRESVAYMAEQGVSAMIEIGAGRVLSGLVKRIAPDAKAFSISDPEGLDAFMRQLEAGI